MVDWDKVGNFDRYPNLAEQLKEVGNEKTVVFLDEGRDVDASVIQEALKQKGQKNIKARNSHVFHVKNKEDNKDYEVWISATSYSVLGVLKKVREENKNTLVNAVVKIKRVSKEDMTQSAFEFSKA